MDGQYILMLSNPFVLEMVFIILKNECISKCKMPFWKNSKVKSDFGLFYITIVF